MDTSDNICTYYKICGQDDNYGNKMLETSLREMMWDCLKFIKKDTLLQTNPCQMGKSIDDIIVNHTSKY